MSARDDSPSRMRIAPCSTRCGHSADAGEPVRATKMCAAAADVRCNPIEERMAGHPPGSSLSTENVGSEARAAAATNKLITSTLPSGEGIPDPQSDVGEIGPPRVEIIHQEGAAHCVNADP